MNVLRTNSAQSSVVDTEESRHNHKERTNWFLLHCVSRPGRSIFREKELSQDRPTAGRELRSFRCDWSWIRRNFKRTTRSRLFHKKKNQIETCTNRHLFCCGKVPVWPRAMTLGRSVLWAKFHITCGRRVGRSSASSVVRSTMRVLQSCRECAQMAKKSQIGTRMFLLGPPWCSKCSQSRFFTRGETLVLPNTTGNYTAKLGDDLLVLQAENEKEVSIFWTRTMLYICISLEYVPLCSVTKSPTKSCCNAKNVRERGGGGGLCTQNNGKSAIIWWDSV